MHYAEFSHCAESDPDSNLNWQLKKWDRNPSPYPSPSPALAIRQVFLRLKGLLVYVLWPFNTGFAILLRSIQGPSDDEEVRTDRHGRRVFPGGSHTAVVEQAASAHGPTVSITPKYYPHVF